MNIANQNTNSRSLLDLQDEITKYISQAEGILSLITHEGTVSTFSEDVINSSLWAVEDLIGKIAETNKQFFDRWRAEKQ